MKNLHGILTAATIILATFGTQLNAGTTEINVLSENDWQQIENTVESEYDYKFEVVEQTNNIAITTLSAEIIPGNFTNKLKLLLEAPILDSQEVGIAIVDSDGEIVHSAAGTFSEIKNLSFNTFSTWDMTYMVRIYSEDHVYESNIELLYH